MSFLLPKHTLLCHQPERRCVWVSPSALAQRSSARDESFRKEDDTGERKQLLKITRLRPSGIWTEPRTPSGTGGCSVCPRWKREAGLTWVVSWNLKTEEDRWAMEIGRTSPMTLAWWSQRENVLTFKKLHLFIQSGWRIPQRQVRFLFSPYSLCQLGSFCVSFVRNRKKNASFTSNVISLN